MVFERKLVHDLLSSSVRRVPLKASHLPLPTRLPLRVESALLATLREVTPDILNDQIALELQTIIQARGLPNYERHWAAFAYMYYAANFTKAFISTRFVAPSLPDRPLSIIDLGCGGGASTLGAIFALHSDNTPAIAHITGVDASIPQLNLFNRVATPWLRELYPYTQIDTCHDDIIHFLRSRRPTADIAIASYIMEELSSQERRELRKLLRQCLEPRSGEAIMIDSAIDDGPGFTVETLEGSETLVDGTSLRFDLSSFSSLGLSVSPKSNLSRRGPSVPGLLEAYFRAWETHDVSRIRQIFSCDAVYEILGSKTLKGSEQIAAYWKRNKDLQRVVRCTIVRSAKAPNIEFAEWKAGFYRVDESAWYSLHGLMLLTIADGQIVSLIESYSQDVQRGALE